MSDTGWLILVALAAIALASMTVRDVAKIRGRELYLYLAAAALAAVLGGAIAIEIDEAHCAVGIAAGLACVELIRRKGDGL
jgi:O-antigen ligase